MVDPSITALLANLEDQGGARFDAVGWHYLDTLARRATAQEGSVRRMLEAKLAQALAAFEGRFAQARCAAAALLASASEQHPAAAAELQGLYAEGDFNGLRRLQGRLQADEQCATLRELIARLEAAVPETPGHAPVPKTQPRVSTSDSAPLELKTVRESRATWARMSVDKQLALAMQQAPANAGPINSHMLVLRSLAMMQDIAPDYLSRMVSYVDTLLLLDPGEKDAPVKRKHATPAKAAKPRKAMKK